MDLIDEEGLCGLAIYIVGNVNNKRKGQTRKLLTGYWAKTFWPPDFDFFIQFPVQNIGSHTRVRLLAWVFIAKDLVFWCQ